MRPDDLVVFDCDQLGYLDSSDIDKLPAGFSDCFQTRHQVIFFLSENNFAVRSCFRMTMSVRLRMEVESLKPKY